MAAATPQSSQVETIKLSRRHSFAVCTGLCPNFDLQVHADGRVELRRVEFDDADEYRQYRVPTRRTATYFQMLDKLRPADGQDVEETRCGADVPAEMKRLHIDVAEVEIVWLSTESAQRLEGCQTEERLEALGDALGVLGLYSDGRRIKQ
jgi:hypothetical protein